MTKEMKGEKGENSRFIDQQKKSDTESEIFIHLRTGSGFNVIDGHSYDAPIVEPVHCLIIDFLNHKLHTRENTNGNM
jgi:hypothetical protein